MKNYESALNFALMLLEMNPELELTSALKEGGSSKGIEWGDDMGAFVEWAYNQLGV